MKLKKGEGIDVKSKHDTDCNKEPGTEWIVLRSRGDSLC